MMPPKSNPLKLNKLQARTLTLMQELARDPATGSPNVETGEVLLSSLPHPHGNHVHIGPFVVSARDISGFSNKAVWAVLERRGLVRGLEFPVALMITPLGQTYDTGLSEQLAQPSDH